jgi:TM2 domain-containing membrane protein YozV
MSQEWFVNVAGQQYGPMSELELRLSLQQGRASATDVFWTQGMPEWTQLAEIPELRYMIEKIPPGASHLPPPAPLQQGPQEPKEESEVLNKKIAAGILGILLGGLGIHKFILGYTKEGIIMLLVSVIGFILIVPSIAMSIIGLIEGIMYLCAPDDEFVRLHKDQTHAWF